MQDYQQRKYKIKIKDKNIGWAELSLDKDNGFS